MNVTAVKTDRIWEEYGMHSKYATAVGMAVHIWWCVAENDEHYSGYCSVFIVFLSFLGSKNELDT